MNLYFVLSEELEVIVCEDWLVGACHYEPYRIAELCIAKTRGQARYHVAVDADAWTNNMDDLPQFSIRKLDEGFDGPTRIVSGSDEFRRYWEQT